MVRVEGLHFSYKTPSGRIPVLSNVNLDIPAGDTVAILGPSGCGKTTFLYILAGLLQPDSGQVLIRGKPLTSRRLQTALILQEYGLLPWKTVWQNVALGLQIRKRPKAEIKDRVEKVLAEMGLSAHRNAYPNQLSGGQKQRVAVARALVLDPDLLLMDEPFSALDALTRERLQDEMLLLWKRHKITMVIVTHSIEEAVFLGQRVVVFSPRLRQIAAVIPSLMNEVGYRKTDAFYKTCLQVRKHLEEFNQASSPT